MRATIDIDDVAEADGRLMFPEVLRPATGEGISARAALAGGREAVSKTA